MIVLIVLAARLFRFEILSCGHAWLADVGDRRVRRVRRDRRERPARTPVPMFVARVATLANTTQAC